ncbi:uncharacterized protein LOC115259323 [Aedes albopictus]|uniref:Secreted protein n=1 Tax=Aedes albopictus TaxID=7160 RepID=A0ABM1XP73_AEDAL
MASIRRASSLSSSSWSSSFLVVTITLVLVVLTICGEIQTATAAATKSGDAAQTSAVDNRSNGVLSAPRTFGRIRMLKNVMLPVMFILGGIKTLLIFLVAISLKTLFVASSIFVINISLGLAKVINFFKHGWGAHHGKDLWSYGQDKNIHIHIHSDPSHHLSLDGPVPPLATVHSSISPTIHSEVFPYSRSDVIEPIYASPSQINSYTKMYGMPTALTNVRPQSLPYTGWQPASRKR